MTGGSSVTTNFPFAVPSERPWRGCQTKKWDRKLAPARGPEEILSSEMAPAGCRTDFLSFGGGLARVPDRFRTMENWSGTGARPKKWDQKLLRHAGRRKFCRRKWLRQGAGPIFDRPEEAWRGCQVHFWPKKHASTVPDQFLITEFPSGTLPDDFRTIKNSSGMVPEGVLTMEKGSGRVPERFLTVKFPSGSLPERFSTMEKRHGTSAGRLQCVVN